MKIFRNMLVMALILVPAMHVQGQIDSIIPVNKNYKPGKVLVIPDDTFELRLKVVVTDYEVSMVTAIMDGDAFDLVFDQSVGYYKGRIPMRGRVQGNRNMIFTAVDFGGGRKTDSIEVRYDRRPELIVYEPKLRLAADKQVRFHISCIDTPFTGCSIDVYQVKGSSAPVRLFGGKDSIDTVINFAVYDTFRIIGIDSIGQRDTVDRRVWHASYENLIPLDTFDFLVHSFSKYYATGEITIGSGMNFTRSIYVEDRRTGKLITDELGANLTNMFFIGDSSFYLKRKDRGLDYSYTLFNGGDVDTLTKKASLFDITGNYIAWTDSFGVWRCNVKTGDTVYIDKRTNGSNALALTHKGELFYSSNSYMRYYNGSSVDTLDTCSKSFHLKASDEMAIWFRGSSVSKSDMVIYDCGSKTISVIPSTEGKAVVCGKIVAFDKRSASGVKQVWIRDTDGSVKQVTGMSDSSTVLAVNPYKYVLVERSNSYYLHSPTLKNKRISENLTSTGGRTAWYEDGFHMSWNGVVFLVDTSFGSTGFLRQSAFNSALFPVKVSTGGGRIQISRGNGEERVRKISIIDIAGHCLSVADMGKNFTCAKTFTTGKLPAGRYLLRIETDLRTYSLPATLVK